MDIYEVGQLVGFVLLISTALLFLEAAMRHSKHQRRAPGRRG